MFSFTAKCACLCTDAGILDEFQKVRKSLKAARANAVRVPCQGPLLVFWHAKQRSHNNFTNPLFIFQKN